MSYSYSFSVAPPTGFTINSSTGLITIADTTAPFTGSISVQVSDGVTSIVQSIAVALTSPEKTALTTQISEGMAIGGEGYTTIEFLRDSGGFAIGGGIATGDSNIMVRSASAASLGTLVATSTVAINGNASVVMMGPLIAIDGTPSNDNFSNARTINATCSPATQSIVTTGSNVGFTKETNEPPDSTVYQKTAWFKFTAPSTVNYNINTIGSNFDTLLIVFSGTSFANLTILASDDDSGGSGTSAVNVTLTAGQQYYVQVAGYNGAQGNYTLTIAYTCV